MRRIGAATGWIIGAAAVMLLAGCREFANPVDPLSGAYVPQRVPVSPLVTFNASADGNYVGLSWPPVEGATGYRALRYPGGLNAAPSEIGIDFLTGDNVYNVDDRNLPDGTYYYRVFAINDAGESNPAEVGPVHVD